MIGELQRHFLERQGEPVPRRIQRAIVQLAEAHDYARDVQTEPWQFAVEIESLEALGVTAADLNWLVQSRYVEHASDVTRPGDTSRRFAPPRNRRASTPLIGLCDGDGSRRLALPRAMKFSRRTCFVLTEAGLGLTCVTPAWMPQRRAA